jgi:ketosteroid isomerase-like protein
MWPRGDVLPAFQRLADGQVTSLRSELAIVQAAFAAAERGDIDTWLAHLAPNVRIHTPRGVTSGPEAALTFARRDPASELRLDIRLLDVTPVHDWIVAATQLSHRWRESGELAEETTALAVCRVRDGLITSLHPIR